NGYPWPPHGFELPKFVAGVNTAILITSSFTVHWSLQSIRRGNRAGMQAGLVLTFLMGLTFLLTQAIEYARVGFAPHDNAFTTIFFCLTGLHGAHVFVGLTIEHPADERRILVIANETVAGNTLHAMIRDKSEGYRTNVLVVAPAQPSPLQHLASDDDPGRRAALERVDASLAKLREAGFS